MRIVLAAAEVSTTTLGPRKETAIGRAAILGARASLDRRAADGAVEELRGAVC